MSTESRRRTQQRYDISMPVEVTYEDRVFQAESRNISLGGMFLELEADIPFGAKVQLSFRVAHLAVPVTADGHVRWVQPGGGLGVQFSGLRAREVWALQKLFAEL